VYPEYYPISRPEGITRTDQIINALPDNLKDSVIYPLDKLLENKSMTAPLYYEIDTHWNMAGAKCAFDVLFAEIKPDFPGIDFPEIAFTSDVSYDSFGDIVLMSGFTGYGKKTIPNIYPLEGWKTYYAYIKNEDLNGVITENTDKALPKAMVFRDSFFVALEPFTSSIFSEAEYIWRWFTKDETEYILQNKPDIIVWEVVERSIGAMPNSTWN
jgi:hypothetical protein